MFKSRFTMPDVLATALLGLIALFFSVAARTAFDTSQARVKCASNLRQIGQAILLYTNESKGTFPRTVYKESTADHPTAYTGVTSNDPFKAGGPLPNDVSAALYLLLRTEDVTSNVFICPATENKADVYGGGIHTALDQYNFPDKSTLSYSYINPYPNSTAIAQGYRLTMALDPTFAVAADMNPGTDALTKVSIQSGTNELRQCNSTNHSGDGQNVLFLDGHVEFQNNPFCGAHRDNIYTFGDSGEDPNSHALLQSSGEGIWGSPASKADSVLLPAAIMPTADATAAPVANAPPPAPPARTPIGPIDPGTDMTTFILGSSLAILLGLAMIVVILALKRRRESSGKSS
jgi:prepilin-type processing-associated H-X9-DG protein